MPLSREILHSYVKETGGTEFADEPLERSLEVLESLGAVRVPVQVPFHDELTGLANILQGSEAATLHGAWLRERPQDYGPQVLARIQLGLSYSATQLVSRPFAEATLFRAGAAYEAATEWTACAPEL